jgi:4-amino-4-deoxy-L-arabinose transferase-like glycosyltransferase
MFVAAIWTFAGGKSLVAVRIVQVALAIATVWLIYRLGTGMFDRSTGALAALGVAVYPSVLFANITILTETLFTFLLVLMIWLCHMALRDSSLTKMALSGVTCGFASLTRSVLWPFPLLAGIVVFVVSRGSWRKRLAMSAIFCACHVVVLAPWAIRNSRLQGVPVAVDTMGGFNLWMANSDATPSDRIWAAVSQGAEQRMARALAEAFPGQRVTEGQKDRWGRNAAVRYMIGHPAVTVKRSLRKFADFWGFDRELLAGITYGMYSPPGTAALVMTLAVLMAYPATMCLAALGLWSTGKRCVPTHLMVAALVLFVCGIHTIVFGHSRYRLPLMPFLLIYAGAGARAAAWRSVRESGWRTGGAAAMVGVLVMIWLHETLIRDAERVRLLYDRLTS